MLLKANKNKEEQV